MPKPGLNFFNPRRKSSGNIMDDVNTSPVHASHVPNDHSGGGFRVLDRAEIERAKQEQAQRKASEKPSSKFGRFGGFGSSGNKARTRSIDEDSPSSSTSKRYADDVSGPVAAPTNSLSSDSKSSSGTQSFTSRPYQPGHYGGSSSTLPSSAESDLNDNMFSGIPRPNVAQHNSSPSLSMNGLRKNLPPIPQSAGSNRYYNGSQIEQQNPGGRPRALTTSSYASTAIPPKLETDLDFGNSDFDDMFSGLEKKPSPPEFPGTESTGRSLLAGRRTFHTEPIKIDRLSEIEPPPKSWDSRGSGDNLIASSVASPVDDTSPPPPPPVHKYAPVASYSPEPIATEFARPKAFDDVDARAVRQSPSIELPQNGSSPERTPAYKSSSSNLKTATPRAPQRTPDHRAPEPEDDEDMFGPSPVKELPPLKSINLTPQRESRPTSMLPSGSSGKVLTQAEYKKQAALQKQQPQVDSDGDDDYDDEDEEEAIRQRQEQEKAHRQRQQMQMAREHMRRSTTAPELPNQAAAGGLGALSNGFPSEISLQADEWSDEDVPLGVLQQHGFPTRNKPPTQPANAMPSHFRSSTPSMPDRPASAGALGNRASSYRPPFARNLPDDIFIGGGLVQPSNRESMGFSRGASSVYGEPAGGGMGYNPEPQFTSLVDQIQMRDMSKQKYMGGASSKKQPTQQNPFTGQLSSQMFAMNQNNNPTRMSTMGMPGMNGANPMMMGGGMPMMGMPQMNQMPFGMYPPNDLMMQQQMYQQMMQFQAQQNMFAGQQQMPQDPRMSMLPPAQDARMSMLGPQPGTGFQAPHFQNNSLQNLNSVGPMSNRPMSVMSFGQGNQGMGQPNRPFSAHLPSIPQSNGGFLGAQPPMNNGYTPSIAPSERSNIGLSARYRPVATGNGMGHQDTQSMTSSLTLQAAGAQNESQRKSPGPQGGMVKGILKNKVPQVTVREEDEEEMDWGRLAARKSRFVSPKDTSNMAGDDMSHLGSMIQ